VALLEVNNITKSFGGLCALRDFSIEVEKGEIVALIGPNGAGKTTAFNVISGYYHPDSGKVIFNQKDISNLRPDQICSFGLARTFQIARPFQGISVLDNIMVGAYAHTNNNKVAYENAMGILHFLKMDGIKDQMASRLPIASRKRLEIARALATEPSMILLDEAMAGLRPSETDEAIEIVRKISEKGIAVLLVEHVMKVVMSLAERVLVLHHGELIATGKPEDIVKNPQVIEAYLGESNVTS